MRAEAAAVEETQRIEHQARRELEIRATQSALETGDVPIAWSVDGRALFFTRVRTPTVEIHRVELSTGRQKLVRSLVIQDPAGVRTPGWISITPDGKYYAYSFERVLSDLYLVDGLK